MEFVKKYIKLALALLVAAIIFIIAKPFLSVSFSFLFDKLWSQPSFFQDPLRMHVTSRDTFSWFFSTITSILGAIGVAFGVHRLVAKYNKDEAEPTTEIGQTALNISITTSSLAPAGYVPQSPRLPPSPRPPSPRPPSSSSPVTHNSASPQPGLSAVPKKSGSAIQRAAARLQLPPMPPEPTHEPPNPTKLTRIPSSLNFVGSGSGAMSSGPIVPAFSRARRGSDPGAPPILTATAERRDNRASSMGGRTDSPMRPAVVPSSNLRSSTTFGVDSGSAQSSMLSPRTSTSPLPGKHLHPQQGRYDRSHDAVAHSSVQDDPLKKASVSPHHIQ